MHGLGALLVVTGMVGCATDAPPFAVADSATFVRASRGLANIELSDFGGTCGAGGADYPHGSSVMRFMLADLDTDSPPTTPGTFVVHPLDDAASGRDAGCLIVSYDAACGVSRTYCTGGTVTLSTVDASHYAGSYDVVIGADHFAGTFDAPICGHVSDDLPTCR